MNTSRAISLLAAYRGDHQKRPRTATEEDCRCSICDEARQFFQRLIEEQTPEPLTFGNALKNALAACDLAQAEAEALLSNSIKREHDQLDAYTKQSWEALMMRHPHDRAIEALAIIAEFRAKCAGLEKRINADHQ